MCGSVSVIVADSVARFTEALTPSSVPSFLSTLRTHDAHVMPWTFIVIVARGAGAVKPGTSSEVSADSEVEESATDSTAVAE